jgi:peptidyl-prolyl cis-trans isomerase C
MGCSLKNVLAHAHRRVVSVNGIVIPQDAISREAQNHPSPTPIAAWTAATRALVVRELLLQEARSRGIKAAPLADEDGRRESNEDALIRGLIETCVTTPSPDEDVCRRYYAQNKARFRSSEIFECSHILIAARRDQPAAFEAARELAEVIRALLLDDPSTFAHLAATHSDCSSRITGGNLGEITSGMTTPEFERALFDLEVGEIRPPIETRYGFHIIKLIRRIPGDLLPFCAARPKIEYYLAARSTRTALAQFIALLAARAQLAGVELPSPSTLRVH